MFPREIKTGRKQRASGCLYTVPFGSYFRVAGTDPNRVTLAISSTSANDWYFRLGTSDDASPYFCMRAGSPPCLLTVEDLGEALTHSVDVYIMTANALVGVTEVAYDGETDS